MAKQTGQNYTESDIRSLDWKEHIRLRPGMYIGKLGDGASADDGIYVLLKEVIDNSIDEHLMGNGKTIEISIRDGAVQVRDYGRGIPHGAVVDCVSKINTGAKYSEGAFSKTVGLNGVGTKAVNALSTEFRIESFREGEVSCPIELGVLKDDEAITKTSLATAPAPVQAEPSVFKGYQYRREHVERLLWEYAYLNNGLTLFSTGRKSTVRMA